MRRSVLIPNKGEDMKNAITLLLLSWFTMLLLACNQVSPIESNKEIVEATKPSDDAKLVFSNLYHNQTNHGTISINGYDRHFSVTFPPSYDVKKKYPVILFFHGCICRPEHTKERILSYLNWSPKLDTFKEDSIVIRMSAYSEKKPAVRVDGVGAPGMWFWHEGLASDRDDYAFVHTMIKTLKSSSEINIDPENIFGVGHSSGALFLLSYALGGPTDLTDISINDTYTFKAISVTGAATLRKEIIDFKENTPDTLPSVLLILGEKDTGLWYNGQETGKSGLNFIEFGQVANGLTIIDGLRDTIHGLTYSAWDENIPSNPSTLERLAKNLNLKYSDYEDYSQYYLYNFPPVASSEKVLVGMRIKSCGHRLNVDPFQSNFFRIFSKQHGDLQVFDNYISRDTSMNLCR